jgi:hypothetical protein
LKFLSEKLGKAGKGKRSKGRREGKKGKKRDVSERPSSTAEIR